MYIALRLLRDGADTTITTRFPRDAARRFAGMPDSADWLHRLRDRRHRPARPRPGRRARRRGRRARAAGHPDQQRRPDGAPLAGGLRPARRAPRRPSCPRGRSRRWSRSGRRRRRRPPRSATRRRATGRRRPHARDRAGARRRVGLARSGSPRHRRSTPAAWCPTSTPVNSWSQRVEEVDARRAARGAALQHDRAVHPDQPAAPGAGRVARAAHVRRQRLGDGGPVQPRLQGARATRTPTWRRPR